MRYHVLLCVLQRSCAFRFSNAPPLLLIAMAAQYHDDMPTPLVSTLEQDNCEFLLAAPVNLNALETRHCTSLTLSGRENQA